MSDHSVKIASEYYREALIIQDAVNLSGVLCTWMKVMKIIREAEDGQTAAINSHPINVLFAYKVATLTGQDFPNEVLNEAWRICREFSGTCDI